MRYIQMANEVHSKHSDLDQPEIISPRKYHTIPYHTTSSILLLFGLQMHVLLLITLH